MSSNPIKTPRKVYLILAAGAAIGAIGAAAILRGPVIPKAFADKTVARPVGDLSSENMAMLRNLNESFAGLSEYISPAVVAIKVEGSRETDVLGRRMPTESGEGSGVIIRKNGWILTNDHVVGGFKDVTVVLNDGREFKGKVTSSDYSDLAVVKIEADNLPTVTFADSNQVRVGQFAIAVGSPFGLENSVTIGHVSALGRDSAIGDPRSGVRTYPDLIQTDAAINRGNSGGPLLDIDGRVIGINTAIFSQTGGSVGVGFAIPANQARLTAEMLMDKGRIVRGYMGMVPENVKLFRQRELGIEGGAAIAQFAEGEAKSPARDAGLKAGDIVLRIGDISIKGQHDVRNAMLVYGPGETVKVEFLRGKDRKTADVRLADATKEQVAPLRRAQNGEEAPQRQNPLQDFPDLQIPEAPEQNPLEDRVPPVREGQARLGVTIEPITEAVRKEFNIPSNVSGVIVRSVEDDSVASRAGLRPGDVINRIGSTEIRSESDIRRAMSGVKWGDSRQVRTTRYTANGLMSKDATVTFE